MVFSIRDISFRCNIWCCVCCRTVPLMSFWVDDLKEKEKSTVAI